MLLDSAGPVLLPRPHFVGQLGVVFIPVDFGICSDLMNPFVNRLSHGSHSEDPLPPPHSQDQGPGDIIVVNLMASLSTESTMLLTGSLTAKCQMSKRRTKSII